MKKSLGAKTLIYPLPVWVVGTYDKESKPNVDKFTESGLTSGKSEFVECYYGAGKSIGK